MSEAAATTLGDWVASDTDTRPGAWTPKAKEPRPNLAVQTSQWSEAVPIGTTLSPGLTAAVRGVLKLATMKQGWDGYRSPAIGSAAISGALSVLGMVEGLELPKP